MWQDRNDRKQRANESHRLHKDRGVGSKRQRKGSVKGSKAQKAMPDSVMLHSSVQRNSLVIQNNLPVGLDTMITNRYLGLVMLSILWTTTAMPVAPENTGNLLGTLPEKDDGRILQRSKRGWMWNQFFLLEEYTGNDNQYVGKLHSNMDRGEGNVKYILTGDGVGSLFLIDENSGDIHATKRLDREERAIYTLHAKVVDKRTNETLEADTEFNIKIHDINDNEPKFSKEIYFASVPEMSDVGTSVIQVTATDADDQTYGNSAKLVYSILQGQPYFSVDSDNGPSKIAAGQEVAPQSSGSRDRSSLGQAEEAVPLRAQTAEAEAPGQ
ncbi:hypothetical protein DPEC_G00073310 [Dallia pectoralis]|uniref:Uncharacterized protein n=1 Tax=Dallia pectoralis TaxID=75939 RepID=A0ACC2H3C4_DALPE|nr:hypothetical protein DPEC_G00073310 [Dallia pectoralis]